MTLHEQITGEDLGVFLDLDDFAEIHDVNGSECRAVLQEISTDDKLTESGGAQYGLYGSLVHVYCRTKDLPEIPVTGQTFSVDGKRYLVTQCDENMGMLTIRLEANDR